jgi:hypothetical protein
LNAAARDLERVASYLAISAGETMQRRTFMQLASLTALGTVLEQSKALAAQSDVAQATLSVDDKILCHVPEDYVGLSFESPQLYNPSYFSPKSKTLVKAFRDLSKHGVLRSGGHLSDVSRWQSSNGDFMTPKQAEGIERGKKYWEWKLTDPSVRDTKDGAITPEAIHNLKGFLDAANWRLIYGLNFGSGSIDRAKDEAKTVADIMGDRLLAFQLGNESDQWSGMAFYRSHPYTFDDYLSEYKSYVSAVQSVVPNARFGGPDVATNLDWLQRFAQEKELQPIFMSSHFYAMGPASSPAMDATFLLGPNARLAKQLDSIHNAIAASGGVSYRMTEGNSCFGGGKPNVSDAYASALWGADYMLRCAGAGFAGVHLHGGGDGYYAPIAVGPELATEIRPLYYGMQFCDGFTGVDLLSCSLATNANASAYFGRKKERSVLGVINKGSSSVSLTLAKGVPTHKPSSASLLTAPSLDAKRGVKRDRWKTHHGPLLLPPYAAILLQWS